MTAEIVWESSTLFRTLWWGMVFALEYDTIRIFRRIVRHKSLGMIILEDIIYWLYISIKMFSICFYVNDGVIRAFILAGFIMGAGLYIKAFSTYYIKYGVALIHLLLKVFGIIVIKPLKFILSMVRMVTGKIFFPISWSCEHIRIHIAALIKKVKGKKKSKL